MCFMRPTSKFFVSKFTSYLNSDRASYYKVVNVILLPSVSLIYNKNTGTKVTLTDFESKTRFTKLKAN